MSAQLSAEIVVIGSGIVGSLAARRLALTWLFHSARK